MRSQRLAVAAGSLRPDGVLDRRRGGIRDALDLFRPYGIRWDAWSAATWGEVPQLQAIAREPSPPWSETLCYGTPLHWALTGGHEAAVLYLIFAVGIDVAATDDGYVRSAVCGRNAQDLVPLLIEQGADPQAVDHAGDRPIDLARRGKRPTAARLLHEAGAA